MQAQAAQFAAVWLWDLATWTSVGPPLEAHSLTVTQMAFSPSGQHLLTVSRDRTFAIFERLPEGTPLLPPAHVKHSCPCLVIT